MKRISLVILTAIILLPVLVLAYTSPGSPRGYVSDFAGVLGPEAVADLNNTLGQYESQSGTQIAVVTISQLQDETIETYAEKLFQEWGVGQRGQDNGALLLLAINDRKLRIEVGYGLEGDLTDVEAKNIIAKTMTPLLKENNFDEAVKQGTAGIILSIGQTDFAAGSQSEQSSKQGGFDPYYIFWFAIFGLMWLGSILARSRSWWLGGVLGGAGGVIVGLIFSSWLWLPFLIVAGLGFDYLVSRKFKSAMTKGKHGNPLFWFMLGGGPHWWDKGGGGGGGGFGGFGGGSFGGGGASGDW